jgi:hypothetical protein
MFFTLLGNRNRITPLYRPYLVTVLSYPDSLATSAYSPCNTTYNRLTVTLAPHYKPFLSTSLPTPLPEQRIKWGESGTASFLDEAKPRMSFGDSDEEECKHENPSSSRLAKKVF